MEGKRSYNYNSKILMSWYYVKKSDSLSIEKLLL